MINMLRKSHLMDMVTKKGLHVMRVDHVTIIMGDEAVPVPIIIHNDGTAIRRQGENMAEVTFEEIVAILGLDTNAEGWLGEEGESESP